MWGEGSTSAEGKEAVMEAALHVCLCHGNDPTHLAFIVARNAPGLSPGDPGEAGRRLRVREENAGTFRPAAQERSRAARTSSRAARRSGSSPSPMTEEMRKTR